MSLMRDIKYLERLALSHKNKAIKLHARIEAYWKDKEVKITSASYNGQVSGNSRPPLTGKTFKVDRVDITSGKTMLFFAEHPGGIDVEGIEVVKKGKKNEDGNTIQNQEG